VDLDPDPLESKTFGRIRIQVSDGTVSKFIESVRNSQLLLIKKISKDPRIGLFANVS
jgi:hypothetical protein